MAHDTLEPRPDGTTRSEREDGARMQRSGRTIPRDGEAAVEGRDDCPLCGFVADENADVYTHLQISHRKSAIAGLVVERV